MGVLHVEIKIERGLLFKNTLSTKYPLFGVARYASPNVRPPVSYVLLKAYRPRDTRLTIQSLDLPKPTPRPAGKPPWAYRLQSRHRTFRRRATGTEAPTSAACNDRSLSARRTRARWCISEMRLISARDVV